MSLANAVLKANALLPGTPAPDGEEDPRWLAIMHVGDYIESNPEEVWQFVVEWGSDPQEDLRAAIGVVLLEHLLEHHFDLIFPRVEQRATGDPLFADMVGQCWKFGQSVHPSNAARFDALLKQRGGYPL